MPILFARESESLSALKRMKAFFLPSGRMSVFTLLTLVLYSLRKASLIWAFEALNAQRNTSKI